MNKLLFILLLLSLNQLHAMASNVHSEKAIDNAIVRYGLQKEPELLTLFAKAHVAYPPQDIALLAFKKEQHIQLWAKDSKNEWRYVHTYPLTAYSGSLGPKLREHDRQIPEGIYRLTMFNPFSSMHLSMMIDYPNSFDRLQASKDGRRLLGGDIFLHGKSASVGCLAVGDQAIDQLFLLTRRVGLNHVQIIIAPNDLRREQPATNKFAQPRWLPQLYNKIARALSRFPLSKQGKDIQKSVAANTVTQRHFTN
ncbi:MAG: L,D-transpeptidase family protein [Legionellaceae bacterium]|nr:L,D-transpeptidase family protein [Legionellaceae bacterium]